MPACRKNLIYSCLSLQDNYTLQDYGIAIESTIMINLHLRGGCSRTSSKNTRSFKDAVKGKDKAQIELATLPELPGPYIIEQKFENPALTIAMPKVNDFYSDLYSKQVICRFNVFLPKYDVFHQWIYVAWSPKCEIYLCPKGFFIVRFRTIQEREHFLNKGQWFWGNFGLFMTPWFLEFDANTMVVTEMPVWVRLHNLLLHFWHHNVLIAIGNSLGKFLKIDKDRLTRGIFNFLRLCVEVDLSQGLAYHITLNFNNTQWTQPLEYKKKAFRCRGCLQIGHLHSACPQAKKIPKWNKK